MKVVDLLQNWEEPRGVSEWGRALKDSASPAWGYYINVNIHPDEMNVLYRVIFPAFVEVADCTLLQINAEGHSEDNLTRFRDQAGSSELFERQFNTLRVYDLFSHRSVKDESSFEQSAHLLKQSWELALQLSFPEKKMEVLLTNSDRDYGPTLTFFTKSSARA